MLMRPFGRGYSSWHEMARMQRDMNRLLGDTSQRLGWSARPSYPAINVWTDQNGVVISAELPGLDNEDVDVSLSQGLLTISGEKKQEQEKKSRNHYRVERFYGSFQRSIPLPSEVDTDKVDAVFRRGVLTITLPKTGEAKARKRIAIKTE